MSNGNDYTKGQLLILAFDHRGTFTEKMLGVKGRAPTPQERGVVAGFKQIIYEGFLKSIDNGVKKSEAGILCDEEFGSKVLSEAHDAGITFASPVEKSGQDVFDFEYGKDFAQHIEKADPTFCKVLVRLNPGGDAESNKLQLGRLKELGDYLAKTRRGYLFELLVPATQAQLDSVKGDKKAFDAKLRPKLMVEAMAQIQDNGIEPDIWKVEGVDKPEDAKALVAQAQKGGRKAGVVTLGRGESKEKVLEWLKVGSKVPGVIGFAVGRTIFWDALSKFHTGASTRQQAVDEISANYAEFVKLWQKA